MDVRRGALWLGLIVLAAAGLRLLYLLQIRSIPFFDELVSDAARYDEWARAIASGDWLGSTTFYQAPAYPYFLALVKVALGDSGLVIRLAQIGLGALSCGLIGLAGWAFVSRRAGLWAAGLLACYAPALFFDGLVQKTALGQFLWCSCLALMGWITVRPGLGKSLALGAVLGLFCLARENALALIPVALIWVYLRPRRDGARRGRGRRLGRSAALVAGLALVLLPVAFRNLHVGGEFVLTTAQMGPNFYIGNNPEATGRYRPLIQGHETPQFEQADASRLAEQALGRSLTPAEVSQFWMDRAWHYIRSQPADWLALTARKWLFVWNAYEVPDTESYELYRHWSWLLAVLGALGHFGLLVPVAAAGVVLAWPLRRRLLGLYVMVLVMALSVAVFYVFGRYRYPIVPVAMILAGAALERAVALARRRAWRALLVPAAVGGLAAVVVNWPIHPEGQLNALAWGNLGSALARQDNLDGAVICFERAVTGAPESAEMHYNLGLAFLVGGQTDRAVDEFQAALRLAPTLVEVDYQLAVALERLGRRDEAVAHYRLAIERRPDDTDAQAALKRLLPDPGR
ncbi:MAG: tetratricopeptide repeat protein [Planctomycetes bacterium]|nr:tetratricopeptide repeat protein [Planctomycetota bacterium]